MKMSFLSKKKNENVFLGNKVLDRMKKTSETFCIMDELSNADLPLGTEVGILDVVTGELLPPLASTDSF
jgi:hypothetical protein